MNEEPIDLKSVEKDNQSAFDWQLYHILKKQLLSNSLTTAGDAAAQINELLLVEDAEPANTSDIDKNPERAETNRTDMIEENLWTFWTLLIKIVKLVPYNHAWQGRLLSILQALSRLPPATIEIWGAETRIWTDLPLLGACMRDNWIQPTYNGEVPDESSNQHWLNLNSFAARLLNTKLTQWTNFALWELTAALEQPPRARPIMNCDVTIAAEWILQGGEALYQAIKEDATDDEARSTKPGPLYSGKAGLCTERWDFWKTRFLEVKESVDVNIAERAGLAAEKMRMLESQNN